MDTKSTPKSAPVGGRKGSLKRDTATTSKEINNWIHKGNKDNEMQRKAARNFNLLTENVTEERMLYARQLELGRERYKFLANHDYEKNKFLERQHSKQKMMKKYMSSARKVIDKAHSDKPKKVLTIRIPQAEELSPTASPTGDEIVTRAQSGVSRISSKSKKRPDSSIPQIHVKPTRTITPAKQRTVIEMPKFDTRESNSSTSRGTRKLGVLRNSSSKKRNERSGISSKSVEFLNQRPKSDQRGFYVNTSDNTDDSSNKLPVVHQPYNGCMYSVVNPQNFRNSNQSKSVRYKDHPAPIASIKRSNTFSGGPVSATTSWLNSPTSRKFGERFDTSVGDPRYQALTSTLVGVDDIKSPGTTVKDIIAANEVLRTTSKNEGVLNAKRMHAKFIALLLEKELK